MRTFSYCLFSKLFIGAYAFRNVHRINTENNHLIADQLLKAILDNREFASTFLEFTEWESPLGDIYVIPSTDEEDTPSMGLGYRFFNDDETALRSGDLKNVVKIKEENVTTLRFPVQWSKHDEATTGGFIPFGTRKYVIIDTDEDPDHSDLYHEEYIGNELIDEIDHLTDHDDDGIFDNAGVLNFPNDIQGDSVSEGKTNKLDNTNAFIFVGVSSVDPLPRRDLIEKRLEEEDTRIITSYTTTTVTSTYEILFTKTDVSKPDNEEHLLTGYSSINGSPLSSTEPSFSGNGGNREQKHEKWKESHKDNQQWSYHGKESLNLPNKSASSTTQKNNPFVLPDSKPVLGGTYPTTETTQETQLHPTHKPVETMWDSFSNKVLSDTVDSKSYAILVTWNSFPLVATETQRLLASVEPNETSHQKVTATNSKVSKSMFPSKSQFKLLTRLGNDTFPAKNMYTTVSPINGSNILSSANRGSSGNNLMNSLLGLLFAVIYVIFFI